MDSAEADHTFLRFPWTFGSEGYITQGYNGSSHQGGDYFALDIDVEWGGTLGDIMAAAYGQVVGAVTGFECTGSGYGNHVDVKSTTPAGGTRYARYAHLSSVSVSSGQTVFQGQTLGVEGDTGYTGDQYGNCGPHLHFRWTTTQNCASSSCAVEPEPMSGQEEFAAGQTWTSDNTAAREGDVATFYNYGSGAARIHTWMEDGGEFGFYSSAGWWGVDSGYTLTNVGDRMVMGDISGDTLKDIATFYDYGGGLAKLHVWFADPMQTDPTVRFQYKGPNGWWTSEGSSYTLGNVAGRMVAGDFDDNGKEDIAVMYGYSSGTTYIDVWLTNDAGTGLLAKQRWWAPTSSYHVVNVADRLVSGDFNWDGKDDVAAFYKYPNDKPKIHVWLADPDNEEFDYAGPNGWWPDPDDPQTYLLSQVGDRMVAGNFNGDNYGDIATFFDVGDGTARINVWINSGSSSFTSQTGGWWYSETGYSLSQVDDRMVSADLDGDAREDIATFYKYGTSGAKINVWLSTGSAFDYRGPNGWWGVDSGYTLSNVAGRMVAGDFDGR